MLYRYAPDRKGEHARAQLANFTGWLHAYGYAGFGKLYEIAGASSSPLPLAGPPRVAEVACWAHVRRGFFDEAKRRGLPIAKEALAKIGALFDIERLIVGASPARRRHVRQRLAKPLLDELAAWLDAQLQRIPGKSHLAGAIRYARSRWPALTTYVDHGQLEISNNAAENAKELALRRQRCRRRARRALLHADPYSDAQRGGARGLPEPRHCPHRRALGEPPARAAALELRISRRRRASPPDPPTVKATTPQSRAYDCLGGLCDASNQIASRPLVHLKLQLTARLSLFEQLVERCKSVEGLIEAWLAPFQRLLNHRSPELCRIAFLRIKRVDRLAHEI